MTLKKNYRFVYFFLLMSTTQKILLTHFWGMIYLLTIDLFISIHFHCGYLLFFQSCAANYTFIPYMVTPQNKVYCCESSLMKGLSELMQPSFEALLGPICMPLLDRLAQLLTSCKTNTWWELTTSFISSLLIFISQLI